MACFNDVAGDNFYVASIKISSNSIEIREKTAGMVIHIERAATKRKAAKCIEADDRPVHTESFDDPRHKHSSATFEHAELGYDALKPKACSILGIGRCESRCEDSHSRMTAQEVDLVP